MFLENHCEKCNHYVEFDGQIKQKLCPIEEAMGIAYFDGKYFPDEQIKRNEDLQWYCTNEDNSIKIPKKKEKVELKGQMNIIKDLAVINKGVEE